jgi:hypothetical protein
MIPVSKTVVDAMPECEVHPDEEAADGVLSISWTPIGTSFGHVYCCWDCAEGSLGRLAHALDESVPGTEPRVELQVLRQPDTRRAAA